MNRDEAKARAKQAAKYAEEKVEQGAKAVERNFMDDWMENIAWVFCGLVVGAMLGKFVL